MSDDSPGANPPEEINHRHEAIADEMLANPQATQKDIAEKLGFTQGWLSTVVNSGTFQAYYRQRRGQFNTKLAEEAQRKTLEVGMQALDKTAQMLEDGDVDPVDVFDKALNRAGMAPQRDRGSGAAGGQENNQYNFYMATPEELAQAREQMKPHGNQDQGPEGSEAQPPALEHQNGGGGGVG